jgi:hypothetical protein
MLAVLLLMSAACGCRQKQKLLVSDLSQVDCVGDTGSVRIEAFSLSSDPSRGRGSVGIDISGKARNLSGDKPVKLSIIFVTNELNNGYPISEKVYRAYDIGPGGEKSLNAFITLVAAMEVTGVERLRLDALLGPVGTKGGQEVRDRKGSTLLLIPPGSVLRLEETPATGSSKYVFEAPVSKEEAVRFIDSYAMDAGLQRDVLPDESGALVRKYSGDAGQVVGGNPNEYNDKYITGKYRSIGGADNKSQVELVTTGY